MISNKITPTLKLLLFCLALVFMRMVKTHQLSYLFLFWNLFLAFIPLWFINRSNKSTNQYLKWFLVGTSLLFLPNAPYVLTDLFHLHKSTIVPMWYDLILIVSFALLSLIYFVKAAHIIFGIIKLHVKSYLFEPIKLLVFMSCGYGIYLGRYLRFNSWDLITDPLILADGIVNSLINENAYKETFAVTFVFGIFLYLLFELFSVTRKNKLNEAFYK
jgi:uncharacterized membrane protein